MALGIRSETSLLRNTFPSTSAFRPRVSADSLLPGCLVLEGQISSQRQRSDPSPVPDSCRPCEPPIPVPPGPLRSQQTMADSANTSSNTDDLGQLEAEMEELSEDDLEGVAGGWSNDPSGP